MREEMNGRAPLIDNIPFVYQTFKLKVYVVRNFIRNLVNKFQL